MSDTILEVRLLLYRVPSNVPQWRRRSGTRSSGRSSAATSSSPAAACPCNGGGPVTLIRCRLLTWLLAAWWPALAAALAAPLSLDC